MRKIVEINIPGNNPGRVDGEQGYIRFSDGTCLVDVHFQDCCESVYADWDHLKDEAGIYDTDFSELSIGYRREGIRLCGIGRSFFVPCYNEQNGYYNSNLDIYFINPNYRGKKAIIEKWLTVPTHDEIY